MTPATHRTFISLEQALQLRQANLLVEESHRVRPRYFDGKFLAARDLTRDQAYFLARQAGFARALGSGVVDGLDVRAGTVASDLQVDAGFGYTSSGELVIAEPAGACVAGAAVPAADTGRAAGPRCARRTRRCATARGCSCSACARWNSAPTLSPPTRARWTGRARWKKATSSKPAR